MTLSVYTEWKKLNLFAEPVDIKNTDIEFYKQYPDMVGRKISAGNRLVEKWMGIRELVIQNKFNDSILDSVAQFPMIPPKVLKALLIQESRFDTIVHNSYGFAGIAQFGISSGRAEGLKITDLVDERLNPKLAILAAGRHLKHKYEAIKPTLDKHGIMDEQEVIKFIVMAYNSGEGVVITALNSCKNPPTKWCDIYYPRITKLTSPLYVAVQKYFKDINGKDLSDSKYLEISQYTPKIMALAEREE